MSSQFFLNISTFNRTIHARLVESFEAHTGVIVGWKEGKKTFIYDIFLTPEPLEESRAA